MILRSQRSIRQPARGAMSLLAIAIVLIQAFVGFGCSKRDGSATAKPPSTEPRVVILSPALGVTARDLGLSPSIVGRHGFDIALDRSLPVCGDFAGIDYETLVGTNPTHVLIEWGSRPLPDRLQSLSTTNGWNVEQFALLTLDDIRSSVRRICETFPSSDTRGKELLTAMDRAWSPGEADLTRVGSVLLLHTVSPPTVLGPGSFHHQLLTSIGAIPAIATGSPYMELDAEDMARLNPSCILLVSARASDAPGRSTPFLSVDEGSALFGAKLTPSLSAVQRGRVAALDNPLALLPSTAMIELAEDMRKVLDIWAAEK